MRISVRLNPRPIVVTLGDAEIAVERNAGFRWTWLDGVEYLLQGRGFFPGFKPKWSISAAGREIWSGRFIGPLLGASRMHWESREGTIVEAVRSSFPVACRANRFVDQHGRCVIAWTRSRRQFFENRYDFVCNCWRSPNFAPIAVGMVIQRLHDWWD